MDHDLQVTHWKRWSALMLIKTELFDRAIPWTELILNQVVDRQARISDDLNLALPYRVSAILSILLALSVILSPFEPGMLLAAPALAAAFFLLHVPLWRFFRLHRGWRFSLAAIFWRVCYDAYSVLGFVGGTGLFAWKFGNRLRADLSRRVFLLSKLGLRKQVIKDSVLP